MQTDVRVRKSCQLFNTATIGIAQQPTASAFSSLPAAAKPVDKDCRVKMCEWCYQVTDFCKFKRETVGIGMTYLDRFVASSEGRAVLLDRKEYQLAAMTSLYMAIKLFEPLEMETSLLSELSRGCYSEAEIAKMETDILVALQWRVHGPTPLGFVQHFLALLPDSIHPSIRTALEDFSRYQTELAVAEYSFVTKNPSTVAMASMLNAMEGISCELFSSKMEEVRSLLRLLFAHSSGGSALHVVTSLHLVEIQKASPQASSRGDPDSSGESEPKWRFLELMRAPSVYQEKTINLNAPMLNNAFHM